MNSDQVLIWLGIFIASLILMIVIRSFRKLVSREDLERELANVQQSIQEIQDENDRLERLNAEIVREAIDRGSQYEQERRSGRQTEIHRNYWLIEDLQKKEKQLKRKLSIP